MRSVENLYMKIGYVSNDMGLQVKQDQQQKRRHALDSVVQRIQNCVHENGAQSKGGGEWVDKRWQKDEGLHAKCIFNVKLCKKRNPIQCSDHWSSKELS